MPSFVSSVRFVAKPDQGEALLACLKEFSLPEGLEQHLAIQTGERSYCTFAFWRSEDDLAAARPSLIAFLDTVRDLLEEISPELGVTDPVSGPVLINDRA